MAVVAADDSTATTVLLLLDIMIIHANYNGIPIILFAVFRP